MMSQNLSNIQKKPNFAGLKPTFMKHFITTLFAVILLPMLANAQELPQFTYTDYDGWTYNNPGRPLTPENISGSKIALYVSQNGLVLTLKCEPFGCQGIDSISAQVYWYTPSFNDPSFVLSKTALTLALDDANGHPKDSVTIVPTTAGTRDHLLNFRIAVPSGLDSISMRFVCWQADVTSCGIIKRALFEAITNTVQPLIGDMDGSGQLDVGDVTQLINKILNEATDEDISKGDLDGSGGLDVGDVTLLIRLILSA